MAEGVLTHLKKSNNLPVHVESAGTVSDVVTFVKHKLIFHSQAGYHEGEVNNALIII